MRLFNSWKKNNKPRVALFSPMPPCPTGIAGYVAALLPYLEQIWDIDVVVEDTAAVNPFPGKSKIISVPEFRQRCHATPYRQHIFHFGNSLWHAYMIRPFLECGGIAVPHDVHLGHLLHGALYHPPSHIRHIPLQALCPPDKDQTIFRHAHDSIFSGQDSLATCAALLLQNIANHADGILFHSSHARHLFDEFAPGLSCPTCVSPLATDLPDSTLTPGAPIRDKWNIPAQHTVCAMFGHLQAFKGLDEVVEALGRLPSRNNITLVLAGSVSEHYTAEADRLFAKARADGVNVVVTGYLEDDQFLEIMGITDFAFSLRTVSHGESSAALLALLSKGIPSIVHAIGSFAELPDAAVLKIPCKDVHALASAIERLQTNTALRAQLSAAALEYTRSVHWPTRIPDYQALFAAAEEYRMACAVGGQLKATP